MDILKKQENDTELPARLYLFQGLPKGDKMEWIVQKAVELGVCMKSFLWRQNEVL